MRQDRLRRALARLVSVVSFALASTPTACRATRLDSRPRRAPPRRTAGRAPPRRRRTSARRGARHRRSCCARSSTSSRRRAARSRPSEGGRAVMDQRNETFVPHVLAITTGTTVDFPELGQVLPQRVFALEGRAVRSRALRRRPLAAGPLRSARHRARVLRHPLAHERVHPRLQPSVLRDDRRARAAIASRTCRRAPTASSPGTKAPRRSRSRSRCPTAASPSWTSRCDESCCRRCGAGSSWRARCSRCSASPSPSTWSTCA